MLKFLAVLAPRPLTGAHVLVGIDIDNASRRVEFQRFIVTGLPGEVKRRAG